MDFTKLTIWLMAVILVEIAVQSSNAALIRRESEAPPAPSSLDDHLNQIEPLPVVDATDEIVVEPPTNISPDSSYTPSRDSTETKLPEAHVTDEPNLTQNNADTNDTIITFNEDEISPDDSAELPLDRNLSTEDYSTEERKSSNEDKMDDAFYESVEFPPQQSVSYEEYYDDSTKESNNDEDKVPYFSSVEYPTQLIDSSEKQILNSFDYNSDGEVYNNSMYSSSSSEIDTPIPPALEEIKLDCRRVQFQNGEPKLDIAIAIEGDVADCLENMQENSDTTITESGKASTRTAEIILYANEFHRGSSYSMTLTKGKCSNVEQRFNDNTESIDARGECIIIYEHSDCIGNSAKLRSGLTFVSEQLRRIRMQDMVSSVELC